MRKQQTPATAKDTSGTRKVEVTEREFAFLTLCRKMGHGTIQTVGVVKGEPATCIGFVERIDLSKPEDLARVMSGKVLPLTGNMHEPAAEEEDEG